MMPEALRAALIAKLNTVRAAEQQQRVSKVLKRATDELRRGKKRAYRQDL
jgi:hypothetical protein